MYSVTWALISPEWHAPPVQHSVLGGRCGDAVPPSADHWMSHTGPSGTAAPGGSELHGAWWCLSGRQWTHPSGLSAQSSRAPAAACQSSLLQVDCTCRYTVQCGGSGMQAPGVQHHCKCKDDSPACGQSHMGILQVKQQACSCKTDFLEVQNGNT